MPAVIQIKDLVKDYKLGEVPVHVLKGISFEIERGDFVSIMGPSGSGKSTLMNILGCLDKPTSGSYTLDGISVAKLNRDQLAEIRNKKIGFVFQQFNLLARTSAAENVELPLMYTDASAGERHERAMKALLAVGLAGREDHQPSQLSGGQQQRVAIARSLVNDPKIILADEPTGALDSRTSIEIMAIFQRLNPEKGITRIVVTHDPDVATYSNRSINFKEGTLRLDHRAGAALTQDDSMAIAAECPSVALSVPTVRGGVQVVYGNNNWATNAQGVTPDYMTIRDATMLFGQFFTNDDVDAAAKVAVLGETVSQTLFGDSDATGQVVIIKNVPFTVAGVLTPKGQSPTGQDQDDVILLPISTAMQKVIGTNKANAKAV